jgi:hypothetical protein
MRVSVEQEAKKKAVKTKQLSLDGKEVAEETNECFFCGKTVDFADVALIKAILGHVVCAKCSAKIVAVISYAGTRYT